MATIRTPREKVELKTHDEHAAHLAKILSTSGLPVDGISRGMSLTCFENFGLRNCRPDVLAIRPTYNLNELRVWTFEVKISRSDFLSDIGAGKWEKYKDFSHFIVFATPWDLITPEEVPAGCKLLQFHPGEQRWIFRGRLKAKNWKGELSLRDWMKLAFGKTQW